ncbi:MAG TPA: TadE/TadG family type IV pilus assembly protein [Patescibacteria group bacterium]|nr:TadE/TadG family type IV pilus assembly protein [Patescibacteria group bacterium]
MSGQSLVEFALILPVLLLILLGAIDFGRLLFTSIAVHNAAREGTAYAVLNPTDMAGITLRAAQESNVQGQRGEGAMSVTVACRNSATQAAVPCSSVPVAGLGSQVTVTVRRPFTFFTPAIGGMFPGFSLDASATGFYLSPVAGVAPGPAPTPTPTPTPSPTPTPGPGATPTPTPSPTPSPTPALCTVPNFVGWRGHDASGIWTGARFEARNLTNVPGNSPISGQSLGAGTSHPCQTATITLN